jgi:hypothetical protein
MADPFFKNLAFAALAQTARNPTRDFLQATPRNPILGYLSDLAASSYSPERTQQMQGVAQFMGAPAISETLNQLSYGEPLTTGSGGLGGTTRIRPEALEAAMTLAPMVAPTARMAGASVRELGPTAARMGEGYLQRQGLMPSIVPKVDETFAGFATPEQYAAARFQGSMDAERWPAAWQRTGAVTPEEILRGKGIVQPPPTQRDKDLYLLESRFSGYMDASKARQFLENDMLKATKKEKDLLRKYYDASGKFIAREEVPVQQAMQEFEQGLTNFMATR